jgi:hypothetical protein
MVTEQDIPKIVDDVRKLLDEKSQKFHVNIQLEQQDYRLEDDWLYLCVTSSDPEVRVLDYSDALDEIEKDLRSHGIDHVLLVPALAD